MDAGLEFNFAEFYAKTPIKGTCQQDFHPGFLNHWLLLALTGTTLIYVGYGSKLKIK